MLTRPLPLLAALLTIVSLVGCEGDTGPMGPPGPIGPTGQNGQPGPSVALFFAVIDGTVDPAGVTSSWPSDVTIAVADAGTGIWDVTLTGTFPAAQGTVLSTMADASAARSLTTLMTSWDTTTIVFRVGVWNVIDSMFIDARLSFVVLGEA